MMAASRFNKFNSVIAAIFIGVLIIFANSNAFAWQSKLNELNNKAMKASLAGQKKEAISLYEQGLDIVRKKGTKSLEAIQLSSIAGVYSGAGRYDKAVEYQKQMLEIYRQLNNSHEVKNTLFRLGASYHSMCSNQDWPKCRTAIEYYRKAGQHDRYIGNIYFRASLLFDDKGIIGIDTDMMLKAVEYYKKGLSYGPEHIRELTRRELGEAYLHLKKYAESAKQFEVADKLTDQSLKPKLLATSDPLLAISYIKSNAPDKAFDFIERTTAKKLAQQLGVKQESFKGIKQYQLSIPADTAIINFAYVRNGYGQRHRLPVQVVVNSEKIMGSELQKYDFVEKIRHQVPDAVRFLDQIRDLNIADDIAPLDSRERRDDMIRPRDQKAFKALISRSEFAMLDIRQGGALSDLEFDAILIHFRQLLMKPRLTDKEIRARELIGRLLYELIFKPIEQQLINKSSLLIIPDGVLSFLPFEAIRMPDGRYLVEKYDIRYTPSLTIFEWIKTRKRNNQSKPILAFGGANYDGYRPVTRSAPLTKNRRDIRERGLIAIKQGKKLNSIYSDFGISEWSDLPGTLAEVRALGEIIKGAHVFTGSEANETRVKQLSRQGRLAGYKSIHFATHGIVLPEFPELSAIVLSQDLTEKGSDDGYLNVREISALKLNADFVNLSACETGLGKISRGEGVSGLTQSFIQAGAKGVSVSLWKVADDPTTEFMKTLYRLVEEEGLPYWRAIGKVKRAFINKSTPAGSNIGVNTSNPFYWAPFVYYGR